MKNSYWNECIYPIFLTTLGSCTLASYTDQELQDELDNLAIRAIAKFKFPKVSLEYDYDNTAAEPDVEVEDQHCKGYYFKNEVTTKEIRVILSWMKVFWLEYQLSKERNYENLYADKDVKAFSSGNLLASIQKAYHEFWSYAKRDEEDYGRVTVYGTPAIGDVNVEV